MKIPKLFGFFLLFEIFTSVLVFILEFTWNGKDSLTTTTKPKCWKLTFPDADWSNEPNEPRWSSCTKNWLQNRNFWNKYFSPRTFCRARLIPIDFLFKIIDFNIDIFIYRLSKSQHRWISTVESRLSMWAQSCITYSTSMTSIPRQRHSVSYNRTRLVKSKERKLQKGGG